LLSFVLCLGTLHLSAQSLLVRVDSLKLPQASLWGGISFNGENISVTSTFFQDRSHLFLRKLDTTLHQVGNIIQLTTNADPVTANHITDHKHLYLNGFHFITFSVAGDSDLYIFKVDKNGVRVGGIVPVVEHTPDRTNDMMLTTDGTLLYVAYFRPTSQSVVHTLDQDLHQVQSPIVTSGQLPHNNLGTMLALNGKFYMLTGDKAGPNSNLILTIWNHDWSPALQLPRLLIQTKAGEGLAFPTGLAYDSLRHRWYVGFHHMQNTNPDSTTHIDIAVFDENFALLEHQHRVSGFRPHFLLMNNVLYSVYDRGGVFIERYRVQDAPAATGQPILWKPYFTIAPEEGIDFSVDSAAIVPGGGVPVLNVTNDGRLVLTSAGGQDMKAFQVGSDGRTYTPMFFSQRGPDGGFVYLPDGRTRFLGEEPAPGNIQQRHKSRIVSWISSDGVQWSKESGIRYQPGAEDDSISSVASIIQVRDSVWRMYFVGDFYRTNGTRTAISRDWGVTWKQESSANVLRKGDVDPHPVYLSDGRYRLYFRAGMGKPPDKSGVGYCDSDDGVRFDTTKIRLLIPDAVVPVMFKLDPAVVKLPNGQVICYIGAAPDLGQSAAPKLIAAWGKKPVTGGIGKNHVLPGYRLEQNFPNPFNPNTTISFQLPAPSARQTRPTESFGRAASGLGVEGSAISLVKLEVFDALGREVATLVNGEKAAGSHIVTFDASGFPSGIYYYRLQAGGYTLTRAMLLIR
jgi:hypothetical protein